MIGIIGGYGSIGREVVKLLIKCGYRDIAIASRKKHEFQNVENQLLNEVHWVQLDINDEKDLQEFIKKTEVVINTAGPSSSISFKVAKCASEVRRHVIDCGYNKQIQTLNLNLDKSILYNMGAVPGLSELLPLVFKSDFKEIESFLHFYGVIGSFTEVAAEDFMAGAMQVDGGKKNKKIDEQVEIKDILPFFEDAKRMIPYENEDTEKIEKLIGCNTGQWYTVIRGEKVNEFLKGVQRRYVIDKEKLVTELCLASELDTMGKNENIRFLIELNGIDESGEEKHQVYCLNAKNQPTLSAAFIVATYESLIEGKVEAGVGSMEKIKNPTELFDKIRSYNVLSLEVLEGVRLMESEEGLL